MLQASQLIECSGDHRAMGEAQGRAARAALQGVIRAFLRGDDFEAARPRLMPRALFQAMAERRATKLMRRELSKQAPEQLARMQGIAAGGGVPVKRLHLGLAAELLLNEVAWIPPGPRGGGACSALGVTGSHSADGLARIAKNFDYPEDYRVGFCVRRNRPKRGLASLDVGVAALAGCHSGVNEAGLALTYNYGYGQDKSDAKLPMTLLAQRVLEGCRSVEDAEHMIRQTPRAGGAILTLADAGGALCVLEVSPTRCEARRGELTAATNHYLTPRLVEVDVPKDAIYGAHALPWLRGLRVHDSSESRFAHLERIASEVERFDLAALEAVLRDHGPAGRGDDGTLCRHGDYYKSTCSVILDPNARSLRVLFGQPCEHPYVEHRLEDSVPAPQRRPLPLAS